MAWVHSSKLWTLGGICTWHCQVLQIGAFKKELVVNICHHITGAIPSAGSRELYSAYIQLEQQHHLPKYLCQSTLLQKCVRVIGAHTFTVERFSRGRAARPCHRLTVGRRERRDIPGMAELWLLLGG